MRSSEKRTAVIPKIEIAYGLADRQGLHIIRMEEGTTIRQTALHSPITEQFPDVDLNTAPLDIFDKVVKDDTVLRTHGRIEMYRLLLTDPKDAHHKRVQDKEEGRQTV